MGKRIDFLHIWNLLLMQFLYYVTIIFLMIIYGFISGSMLMVRQRTTGDTIFESLFIIMIIPAPIVFNILRYFALKRQGLIIYSKSHLIVQAVYIIAMAVMFLYHTFI